MSIYQAYMGVTVACNLKFPHCYSQKERQSTGVLHTPIALVEKIFLQLQKLGVFKICFGYSETLLHPKIEDVLSLCKKYDFCSEIISNGVATTEEQIKLLSKYGTSLSISLDKPDERHDVFRNHNGLFAKIVNVLVLCRKYHVRTTLICTQFEDNPGFYKKYQELAEKYDCFVNFLTEVSPEAHTKEFF